MTASTLSIFFAALFLFILILLHFLKPELDPSWRMISEYEIGRFGWLMRLAFPIWGYSVFFLVVTTMPYLVPIAGTISRWWFTVIIFALFLAGLFKTDPITNQTHSLINRFHTLCGAVVILTFPIAASLAVHSLLKFPQWSAHGIWLYLATLLAWLGMVVYFGTIISARVRNPQSGEPGGPHINFGWQNRFNVLTYILWIVVVDGIALTI